MKNYFGSLREQQKVKSTAQLFLEFIAKGVREQQGVGESIDVAVLSPKTILWLESNKPEMKLASTNLILRDIVIKQIVHTSKKIILNHTAFPLADLFFLPEKMVNPKAVFWDNSNPGLIYVF